MFGRTPQTQGPSVQRLHFLYITRVQTIPNATWFMLSTWFFSFLHRPTEMTTWHGLLFLKWRILHFAMSVAPRLQLGNSGSSSQIALLLVDSSAAVTDSWVVSATTYFPKGTWHHIAFTFDFSTLSGKLYRNGNHRIHVWVLLCVLLLISVQDIN